MGVLATEDFTGTDANPIGGNWTTLTGLSAVRRVSNKLQGGGLYTTAGAYHNATTPPADQYAKILITTATWGFGEVGVSVRSSTSEYTNYLAIASDGYLSLYKYSAGTETQIGSSYVITWAANDVLEIRAVGTTISVWVNGTSRISQTDSSISSGRAGVYIKEGNNVLPIDDFEVGDFSSSSNAPRATHQLKLMGAM